MRKITIQTFMSLDGVLQAPGAPEEDRDGGFTLGGWSQPYWDEMMGEVMGESMAEDYDLLLGRTTYDIFAAHWPNVGDDDPVAQKFKRATKYVVTSTPETLDWENSQAITGEVCKEISELKNGRGLPLSVQGSSQLIQLLLENGLADEFFVWTFPVVLGSGKRLFDSSAKPRALELHSTRTSTTGVTMARYRAAGGVKVGSFALPE